MMMMMMMVQCYSFVYSEFHGGAEEVKEGMCRWNMKGKAAVLCSCLLLSASFYGVIEFAGFQGIPSKVN